jgi:two-component system sensor histidine kinase AlgZ
MNEVSSIKQNAASDALPNFRNLGVVLRTLLLGNALAIVGAIYQATGWKDVLAQILSSTTLLAPIMLSSLLLLWGGQPVLNRLSYWRGIWVVNALVGLVTLFIYAIGSRLYQLPGGFYFSLLRGEFISMSMTSMLMMYFRLRSRILSKAVEDARLQVLRARIRPHFLYNTINAVLGILRAQPKQAETALEDMADLFRVAMTDANDLVPLQREVALCKQYLALERLRMGDRLTVNWEIEEMPEDALIPALLLQPLLENAVYHGIEPLAEGGSIEVSLRRQGSALRILVSNPCSVHASARPHAGNKVALQNIRERLALLFDAEASYHIANGEDFYRVEISLPYMKEK